MGRKGHTLGKCYFEVLQEDPDFGEGKTTRKPFYTNEDGFILKRYTGGGQARVFVPKVKVRIGGEQYSMREILIHSAHHHIQHYGTNKTYRTLARDTIWPGQWNRLDAL